MARHRRIDLRMHADAKYRQLTPCPPCGQALWWNLLAGRQTGIIPGLCSIGEASFAEQLRWPLKGFREAFEEVSRLGMVEADWNSHLVWVPNAIKYNQPTSPNVIRSWGDAWGELPECALKGKAYAFLKDFMKGLSKGYQEAFREACPEPFVKTSPNQEQDQEQDQEQEYPQPPAERGAAPKFTKPTVAEVVAYCRERGNGIDPQRFVDFYDSKGWVVGKSPMKDWKAAVRNWEKNSKADPGKPSLAQQFAASASEFLSRGES